MADNVSSQPGSRRASNEDDDTSSEASVNFMSITAMEPPSYAPPPVPQVSDGDESDDDYCSLVVDSPQVTRDTPRKLSKDAMVPLYLLPSRIQQELVEVVLLFVLLFFE